MTKFFEYGGVFLFMALIMATVLLSQRGGLTITHKPKLPFLDTQKIMCTGYFKEVCHVRFSTEIGDPEKYSDFLLLLDRLDSNDHVFLHLAGKGGQVRTTIQLVNAIQSSKARVTTVVEAPVYSAHAFLAVSGDDSIIHPTVMFMFHRTSLYGKHRAVCNKQRGKVDRTISAEFKCRDYVRHTLAIDREMMQRLVGHILSADEFKRMMRGHDIILHGGQVANRLQGKQ